MIKFQLSFDTKELETALEKQVYENNKRTSKEALQELMDKTPVDTGGS